VLLRAVLFAAARLLLLAATPHPAKQPQAMSNHGSFSTLACLLAACCTALLQWVQTIVFAAYCTNSCLLLLHERVNSYVPAPYTNSSEQSRNLSTASRTEGTSA
jgi:hypothetical protein